MLRCRILVFLLYFEKTGSELCKNLEKSLLEYRAQVVWIKTWEVWKKMQGVKINISFHFLKGQGIFLYLSLHFVTGGDTYMRFLIMKLGLMFFTKFFVILIQ